MLKGIDVSKHQNTIDFERVKNAGIDFVIIRAGYGKTSVDSFFKTNIESAIKYGLKIGVYWFIYGLNEEDAKTNAKKFIKTIEPYKQHITLKCWCDFEYDTESYANKKGVIFNKTTRMSMINTFCEYVVNAGYEVGIYSNLDYIKTKLGDIKKYPLWLAQYSKTKSYDCYLWQYSSKGTVDGIATYVDMNYLCDNMKASCEYYPAYKGTTKSIVQALQSMGIDATYKHRKEIAKVNNISYYIGTASQNLLMLSLLKNGNLLIG